MSNLVSRQYRDLNVTKPTDSLINLLNKLFTHSKVHYGIGIHSDGYGTFKLALIERRKPVSPYIIRGIATAIIADDAVTFAKLYE